MSRWSEEDLQKAMEDANFDIAYGEYMYRLWKDRQNKMLVKQDQLERLAEEQEYQRRMAEQEQDAQDEAAYQQYLQEQEQAAFECTNSPQDEVDF